MGDDDEIIAQVALAILGDYDADYRISELEGYEG